MQLVVDPSYPHCEEAVEGFVRSVFLTLAFLLLASSLTAQQNVARGQAQPDRTVVILGE
jgi:hypothetical protein